MIVHTAPFTSLLYLGTSSISLLHLFAALKSLAMKMPRALHYILIRCGFPSIPASACPVNSPVDGQMSSRTPAPLMYV